MAKLFQGTPLSPGLAQGMIHLQHNMFDLFDDLEHPGHHNIDDELENYDTASRKISGELLHLAARVSREIDAHLSEVFNAHHLIVNDQALRVEIQKEIVDNLLTAGGAVKKIFLQWEQRFLLMESQIAREKADDLHDISLRLRAALAGISIHPLENIPENCVLVMQRLLPSETLFLASRSTAAVLLEYGTIGSHAALFARQMGVPCISGIPKIMKRMQGEGVALVDADEGAVTLNPTRKMCTGFQTRITEKSASLEEIRQKALEPAVTRNGTIISVNANVGCATDGVIASQNGADGIGLYRIEQFYISRPQPPSEDELYAELQNTLSPFRGHRVGIRLLDIGGDKHLPYIDFLLEENPALGRRGIRMLIEYDGLLSTQINAILRLTQDYTVLIIIPMVTIAKDAEVVRRAVKKRCKHLQIPQPLIGAMIETPAAALSAGVIAPFVDFMTFGTNDLAQYAFAADRENAAVQEYYDDASEVIFRLISLVHADVPEMPLSVCGELAGRAKYVARLLASGISSLSVAGPLVPLIKQAVRETDFYPYTAR